MKKLILIAAALLMATTLAAQTIPGAPGYQLPVTVTAQQWFGTSTPDTYTYPAQPGDLFFNTSAHTVYYCAAPVTARISNVSGGNPACSTIAAGQWTLLGNITSTTGTGNVVLATSPTITTPTITAPVIATVTNTGTETLPSSTGGIPIVIACGNTTTGSGTCANTAVGATAKVYFGNATLASNAQTVTISPGFTSSSTFQCLGNDQTTRANPVQVIPASGTTFTITNTTGASDVIQWACFGY